MRLDHTIANHFAADELAALAAELGLDADDQGAAPADLVAALAAQGRAAGLVAALSARAPGVAWGELEWPPAALAAIHDTLDRRLDADGLRDLCLRLGVDPDNLPGETKRARARELVRAMARAGRVGELGIRNYELGMGSGGWRVASGGWRVVSPERRTTDAAPVATGRRSLVTFLCVLAALLFWRVWATSDAWGAAAYPPPATGHAPLTVAVAEFAETADCRRGPAGREAGTLVYETLERELAAAGLSRRVALTRVGRVCDTADAMATGQEARAAVVVWGWLPQTTDGLFAEFTLVDAAAPVSADLARSFEALFTGPGEALSLRLAGRAVVLSRFLLGLLHAAQGEYAAAETLLGAAITAVEAEMAADAGGAAELRRTLAVLLTERGKARAALGRAEEGRADFDAAERLNPDYLRLLVARAAEAYGRRDWAAARRYLDRAALQDEPLPTIAYGYGLLDYYNGQYATAVAHFDRALALSAGLSDSGRAAVYRLARGYSYVALGDCGAATADFAAVHNDGAAPAEVRAAAIEAGCSRNNPLPNPLPEGEGVEGAVGVGGRPDTGATTDLPPRLSPQEMAAAALPEAKPTPLAISDACAPTSSLPCPPASLPACASCTATPTPGPLLLQVGTRGANVRRGPGAEYPVMTTRRAGAQLEALAANVSGEWLQVRVPGQGRGWVSAAYVMAFGEVGMLGISSGDTRTGGEAAGGAATATRGAAHAASATAAWPGAAQPAATPSPVWTPPGIVTPTAPAPPAAPLPTRTPPAPLMPTATLLPPPTARAGGRP